jgi:NAD(P)H-hydrate epimerase
VVDNRLCHCEPNEVSATKTSADPSAKFGGSEAISEIASSPTAPRNDGDSFIIDAIFGIGLKSDVTGIYREAIEWINQSGKPVLAVDIPSGLDADTGEVHGIAVRATYTATLAAVKHGLVRGEGPHYSGEIHVIDIGLPRQLLIS